MTTWSRSVKWTSPALAGMLAGLLSLAVYASTLAPGLTWANDSSDGGELAAAAYTLGVPHPPGYPIYVLLAHPFTRLGLPSVAAGTNLFSALCAAATAGLLCSSVVVSCRRSAAALHIGDDTHLACLSGLAAALLLAGSPLLWSLATVTEVHALNALFAVLALHVAIRVGHHTTLAAWQTSLLGALVGTLWGMAAGNHLTGLLVLTPLVVFALARLARLSSVRAAVLPALGGLGVGLASYILLPLRALAHPAMNWGDPHTPARFWQVVAAEAYRGFIFGLPTAYLPARLLAWAHMAVQQLTPPGLLLAALGVVGLWQVERRLAVSITAAMALCSVFSIGYNTTDSYQYLLPVVVLGAFLTGVGLHRFASALAHRGGHAGRLARPLVWMAVAAALAVGATRYHAQDLSNDHATRDFARATLLHAPLRAILISQQDGHTFALWYYQSAEAVRLDVVVVDTGLLGEGWYNEQTEARAGPLPGDAFALLTAIGQGVTDLRPIAGRPVCLVDAKTSTIPFGLKCSATES